ncbi:cerebellar degeneration-related protein 2-like isoform X2 [Tribolium castaneum]|uniref:Cerebellar degeneration-related protein 2-like Protein n=1 Tax=Tribolium castaneum TaxID=7070 RepID=D6X2L7_TRICA|nr:PREDICTED: cerebellar degeneration-related protein 2-like isoform X2 [Tribolium castaneum]EFA09463.2 Cerebellar degeneration-related protein 2-like Protein [Tribolium castaneum]|eukprot:XP_008199921.1 PREDICTED: cerebellar degeneration-related protein 2-like isoform X2 [Tribolium castaneum]
MASFRDLQMDWASLCQDCTECWTSEDLQLAAELGKTLLERNKELETALKQHQNVIEDQTQEIEYLTKQTVALREVSDSRLRIYEQLEVSIQDLERANHRLVLENSAGKKHIKTLTTNIESLETRCEELQTTIDDLRLQVDALKRRAQRPVEVKSTPPATITLRHVEKYDEEATPTSPEPKTHTIDAQCVKNSTPIKTEPPQVNNEDKENDDNLEQISQLMAQLRESKTQASRDQRRITELEEQLATMIQQNQALENQVIQLHHRDDDMKSMYDELSTLEEVRKGQMCSRCLRNIDRGSDVAEDDDSSILDNLMNSPQHHRSSFSLDVQEHVRTPSDKETGNLYKDLVEKYEALLEVHRQPHRQSKRNNGVSLQEELQMSGDFSVATTKDTDEESGLDSLKQVHPKARMTISHTPTDFSEAETSSSGFSDETSNKYTQTEDRPGAFLCTIADGEDRFSIYNDASPISSRFKNQPEYQDLFKEIFTVLKKTADTKTEIPKIEDKTPPRALPEDESQITELDDDSQSVVSSTMSELSMSQNEPTTIIENIIQAQNQPIPDAEVQEKPERVLKPLVRQPLEYLSVEVRKRSSSRRKNKFAERSDSPVTHIIGSPKISYSSRPSSGRKRRDFKNVPENDATWNGNTIQFWSSNRNIASPTPSQGSGKFEFRPSLASQELHKLKKLDLSYAEVVRKADSKKQVARQRRK